MPLHNQFDSFILDVISKSLSAGEPVPEGIELAFHAVDQNLEARLLMLRPELPTLCPEFWVPLDVLPFEPKFGERIKVTSKGWAKAPPETLKDAAVVRELLGLLDRLP